MSETLRFVPFGLGSIGGALTQECLRRGHEVVAGVDVDPAKVNRDVGDVIGVKDELGALVYPDLAGAVHKGDADVVLHAATSYIWEAHPQLAAAFLTGADVVSTCEELAYPWRSHRHFAQEIDQAAKWEGVTALGTGVNPGFVMDALIVMLASTCKEVGRVEARRTLDASRRRLPLQQKVGIGLTAEEFGERAKEGKIGHVGIYESIDMIGTAFGWNLSEVTSDVEPVISATEMETPAGMAPAGRVAGLHQTGIGYRKGEEVVHLELEMSWKPERTEDVIVIKGDPGFEFHIPGGLPGDEATVAAVVNAIPRVVEAEPGLKTMLDLPLPSYFEPLPAVV